MDLRDRARELDEDRRGVGDREHTAADQLRERGTLAVLHDQVRHVVRAARLEAEREDPRQVGGVEPLRQRDLVREPVPVDALEPGDHDVGTALAIGGQRDRLLATVVVEPLDRVVALGERRGQIADLHGPPSLARHDETLDSALLMIDSTSAIGSLPLWA